MCFLFVICLIYILISGLQSRGAELARQVGVSLLGMTSGGSDADLYKTALKRSFVLFWIDRQSSINYIKWQRLY